MKTYTEKEKLCETLFADGGNYWHVFTNGRDTPLLFASPDDFVFVMNVIAQAAACYFAEIKLITFAVMNNHFHFVISAHGDGSIHSFFDLLKKRLSRSMPLVKPVTLNLKRITDLKSLRNNIVYVNRNGYVANPDCTPFNYPWGSGRFYFNDCNSGGTPYSDFYADFKRKMFRGREPKLPVDWLVRDGYIVPGSYCAVKFGMSLFRDAHHYFSMVSKNVEAYSGVAVEIDDREYLTDSELFEQLLRIIRERYAQTSLKTLSGAQKQDLARCLHYDFRSSNAQIRRLLGLSHYEIAALFPLSDSGK